MQEVRMILQRSLSLIAVIGFLASLSALNLGMFGLQKAAAAQLTSRSVTISSSAPGGENNGTAGTGNNGTSARHTFAFTTPTTGNIGGMLFQYCTTAIGTCTAPTGMNTETMTALNSTTGFTGTFTQDITTDANTASNINTNYPGCVNGPGGDTLGQANCLLISTGSPVSETTGARTVSFGSAGGGWVTNPTAVGNYFVRVYTFTTNTYATMVDDGTVAFSIDTTINVTAIVKETLGFSTTALNSAAGVPAETSACVALTGTGSIALGDAQGALSISQAYDKQSYFRLFSNSVNGTTVKYSGDTLKKGAQDIDPMTGAENAASTTSLVGTEQFGIAITTAPDTSGGVLDLSTTFGAAGQVALDSLYDEGAGTITNAGTAEFRFDVASLTTPTTIASSASTGGYVTCDTAAVRYLGNISPNTPAGVYTTRINYIATPTY